MSIESSYNSRKLPVMPNSFSLSTSENPLPSLLSYESCVNGKKIKTTTRDIYKQPRVKFKYQCMPDCKSIPRYDIKAYADIEFNFEDRNTKRSETILCSSGYYSVEFYKYHILLTKTKNISENSSSSSSGKDYKHTQVKKWLGLENFSEKEKSLLVKDSSTVDATVSPRDKILNVTFSLVTYKDETPNRPDL